jgi:hypothetical protein
MEVSDQLQVSADNARTDNCVPVGLEAGWGPGPVWIQWSNERFSRYGKINCIYAFLIHRLKKTFPCNEIFQNINV